MAPADEEEEDEEEPETLEFGPEEQTMVEEEEEEEEAEDDELPLGVPRLSAVEREKNVFFHFEELLLTLHT